MELVHCPKLQTEQNMAFRIRKTVFAQVLRSCGLLTDSTLRNPGNQKYGTVIICHSFTFRVTEHGYVTRLSITTHGLLTHILGGRIENNGETAYLIGRQKYHSFLLRKF